MPCLPSRTVRRLGLLVATPLLAASCGGGETTPSTPAAPVTGRARAYLDEVVGIMEANSIHRLTINWSHFRTTVYGTAAGAEEIPQTYPALTAALGLLGDGHSSFRTAAGTVLRSPSRACSGSGAPVPTVPSHIGYVRVGAFTGSGPAATQFANGIQNAIMSADRADLVGWIVDLRGNGGGNMWPMVAGLGPVIGEGVIGYFIDPLGREIAWEYRDGAAWSGGFLQQRVDQPYRLERERPRVAVLTDNAVASSGEAAAIAFRGRPQTRSFGFETCGLSTANQGFPISDGALLNLTVAVIADRNRTRYGDSLAPDERIIESFAVVERAIAWLEGSG